MSNWLSKAAERWPDRTALKLVSGATLSYRTLARRADEAAGQLKCAGVGAGARVAWLGHSAGHGVPLLYALGRLGAVFVPLNTRLTAGELGGLVAQARPLLLLCERATLALAAPLAAVVTVRRVDEWEDASPTAAPGADFLPYATQSIVFTSGTTGTPKGAQITWANQIASAQASAARIGASADDRWLLTLPLYHVGGMAIPLRAVLCGAAVVEWDGAAGFDPERMMRVLRDERITHVSLVPTMLHRLLDAGFAGTPDLRVILLGGAAASPDLLERAIEWGLPVAPTYGLTEACSQVATLPPDAVPRKPGSVGPPLSGTTVTIRRDDGTTAGPGEVGEILVRGPTVFAGYLNRPDDRDLQSGTLFTGDLGYLDADGNLFLVQRRTDLIVTGGENVYPAEVEAVLRAHPAIADACVVGLPDAEWGQQVAAAVVLKPGAVLDEALLDKWCRERLAGYKRPRQFRVLEALPVTATGKVIRGEVSALFSTLD